MSWFTKIVGSVTGNVAEVTAANELKVNFASGSGVVSGNRSDNTAVPGATNIGVLPAVANAAAPAATEGNEVLLSTDLNRLLRVLANLTQINSVALLAGNGVTGTGSPRVTIASDNTPWTSQGGKTNNNAAPGATNLGALIALANAAAPAWTEGNEVLASTDLIGNIRVKEPESTLMVTATAAVNTGSTATLPAAGAGLFHYITKIELVKLYSIIGVAAGAGNIITSTNLPGGPAWTTEQVVGAVGACVTVINAEYGRPLKSSVANTATTFVAPAQLQTIWRWNITHYTGP